MFQQDDPKIIKSRHSGSFTKDGVTVEISIVRLVDTKWSLEVVDAAGTSYVWDEEFDTDDAAHREFVRTVETEGMLEFRVVAKGKPH
jgi:hypothetical protein